MEASPGFLKLRAIAFSCITALSLVWIVFLCVIAFYRWDISDHLERSLILVILLANAITVIALPVLILIPFRPWLDAARFAFLLVAHIGTAIAFTLLNPTFTCPEQTPDQEGVCKLLGMYILLANWVIPTLLITYSIGLALMVYRHSRRSPMASLSELGSGSKQDEEAVIGQGSILSMIGPDVTEEEPSTNTTGSLSRSLEQSAVSNIRQKPAVALKRGSRISNALLSKPVPALYF